MDVQHWIFVALTVDEHGAMESAWLTIWRLWNKVVEMFYVVAISDIKSFEGREVLLCVTHLPGFATILTTFLMPSLLL